MVNILIANPKGGSGKTTLSTNLAGYFARRNEIVTLRDLDRQQSATRWIERRPGELPLIHSKNLKSKSQPIDSDWIITDSPAGLREEKLSDAVKQADCVIVPIQPSAFDIGATSNFLDILIEEKAIRKNKTFVALVGVRVNSRTLSAISLAEFMAKADFEVLTYLRNAQAYVTAAEQGLSLFDMRNSVVEQDLIQWNPLLDWVKNISANDK
ncbi:MULTISPECIES: ParA family protein [Methylotenera]|uniref:ParA family protein n=1 Tax=Methylotenera TaxID=359407 RepID=UPI00036D6853|nr:MULTISPECIES: ParA family protein [Methylotenera]